MTITQRDIRKFTTKYHRNGTRGTGFHLSRFIFLRGAAAVELSAITFGGQPELTAVSAEDPCARWDGPEFYDAVTSAIAAVERAQPETIYS